MYQKLYKKLLSTASTLSAGFQDITKDELEIGDVGLLYRTAGEGTNHIGMYIGNNQWIHCSSGKGTVAVSNFHFRKYLRIIDSNNYIHQTAPAIHKEEEIKDKKEDIIFDWNTIFFNR